MPAYSGAKKKEEGRSKKKQKRSDGEDLPIDEVDEAVWEAEFGEKSEAEKLEGEFAKPPPPINSKRFTFLMSATLGLSDECRRNLKKWKKRGKKAQEEGND